MNRVSYARPTDVAEAIREIAAEPGARFIAGGTNLVDLMKYDVERPTRLVDITRIAGLDRIEPLPDGGLRIGALAKNTDIAHDARVASSYPLLADTILAGASAQLRNAASTGGNLLQRTRCYYFYDTATPCNKREPGSGCPAIGGLNRLHAILGASASCIATHPSDMCVALAALEATVQVEGPLGARSIAFADFHLLPGEHPERDTALERDEIITSVDLPAPRFARHHTFALRPGSQAAAQPPSVFARMQRQLQSAALGSRERLQDRLEQPIGTGLGRPHAHPVGIERRESRARADQHPTHARALPRPQGQQRPGG